MDGAAAAAAAAPVSVAETDSASLSPPHVADESLVGPLEHSTVEVQPPPSDDEHEQEHDQEKDQYHDHSPGTDVLTDDLKHKIIKQVEYYFSDENLPTDKNMINLIKKNKQGFVPISVIASFRKMTKLTRDLPSVVTALRESSLLVVSSDGKKVKRLNPFPFTEVRDSKKFTVLVENLPEDHSVDNIRRIFAKAGKIKSICIRDPHATEESKKGGKAEILISSKLHALVEYETVEAAEKAVATLNDEEDWRNGLRVKLLKRMGKYGLRRQAWRESDSEKACAGPTSDQVGDENSNLSEHHDDTPDEEEHLSKEKTGQKGRNRGRPMRQKYRGSNGIGHGTSSTTHSTENPKPPPGPKMPDGTRGFTIGRGRPPASSQN